jgi:hypothetical protein
MRDEFAAYTTRCLGGDRGCSSGVEHNLAKVGVEGSNPFARSKFSNPTERLGLIVSTIKVQLAGS